MADLSKALFYTDTMGSITEYGRLPAVAVDNTEGWTPTNVIDSMFYVSIGWANEDDYAASGINDEQACEDCGKPIEPDPDGSPGVWVHARGLGDHAYDQDEDHAARPPERRN